MDSREIVASTLNYDASHAYIGLEPKWQEYACDEFVKCGRRENYI
ncbi:hypothetical protein JOD02_000006 [Caldicoprobacter guelmensis]|nr:hypothetical protein [Caldicoprobacter guelmensis]MBM7581183.1 hypothetical protein [Caldicoprobacter guelmensis]